MGICTGSFAAAAISTSQTLSELVPAGVEAVLVAFKTGLRSLEVRDDVETPIADASRSWSVVLSIEEAQATKIVETFVSKKVSLSRVYESIHLTSFRRAYLQTRDLISVLSHPRV